VRACMRVCVRVCVRACVRAGVFRHKSVYLLRASIYSSCC